MVYQWRDGTHTAGVPVEAAIEQIEAVRAKHPEGKALREALVTASRSADAPLHPIIFDKTDKEAAWEYRLGKAAYVLRSIVVVHVNPATEKKTQEPVYISLATKPSSDNAGYTPFEVAVERPDLRAELVAKALDVLCSWREKYSQLSAEFGPIFAAIDAFTEERFAV